MQEICDKLPPLCAQGLRTVHLSAISMFFLSETNVSCSKLSQAPTNNRLLHFLVNFGHRNKLIKNIPSTKDLHIHIIYWKEIIVMDLHSAFYQTHMSSNALLYLGLMRLFGRLCVLAHSRQGLIGQSKYLDKPISKILKDESKDGIMAKIFDNWIIGDVDQRDADQNYAWVIYKLKLVNLKVEPTKIHIFPESYDITRWIWKDVVFLEVSPHRKNSLPNTKKKHITKVTHLRSFIGLYKILHIFTPAISKVLALLQEAIARKQLHQPITWELRPQPLYEVQGGQGPH